MLFRSNNNVVTPASQFKIKIPVKVNVSGMVYIDQVFQFLCCSCCQARKPNLASEYSFGLLIRS